MVKLVENRAHRSAGENRAWAGQTILREALLLADHNAYHLGQFVLVLPGLGCMEGNLDSRLAGFRERNDYNETL